MPQIPSPPSSLTGPTADYLHVLWRAINAMPAMSYFSGTDPNNSVLGVAPNLAFNVGSASTNSRLWQKTGSITVPSMTGWVVIS